MNGTLKHKENREDIKSTVAMNIVENVSQQEHGENKVALRI